MPNTACWAQQCKDTIQSSATEGRFIPLNDGTVIDRAGYLIWMRCSVGQYWDNDKKICIGSPTILTWRQARQSADHQAQLSKAPWRLPSIQELSSIAEMRCVDPAIDLRVFPNTPAMHYWTSTPFVNQDEHFWLLQFLTGENNTDSIKRAALVRLVKSVQK